MENLDKKPFIERNLTKIIVVGALIIAIVIIFIALNNQAKINYYR